MEETLKMILAEMQELKAGQKEIQADIVGLKTDVTDLKSDVTILKADVDRIKEDTAITRDSVNGLGDWAEVVADVLRVKYPISE